MTEIPGVDPVVSELMTGNPWDGASSFGVLGLARYEVQKITHFPSAARLC